MGYYLLPYTSLLFADWLVLCSLPLLPPIKGCITMDYNVASTSSSATLVRIFAAEELGQQGLAACCESARLGKNLIDSC